MNWKYLTKSESKLIVEKANQDLTKIISINDSNYKELRDMIIVAFNKTLSILNIDKEKLYNSSFKYKFDCYFGKELYIIFNVEKYKIYEREASNDDFWRYIQINVVPEIIFYRWKEKIAPRIYSQSNRLYLKTLWWYYYLSFNNNIDYTCALLLNSCNSTDTIVALVERCGRKGYRVDLYREIMKQKSEKIIEQEEFRKLMVLNNARINMINPYLTNDGIEGYVEDLVNLCRSDKNERN